MLQFYFLSILLNLITGLVLVFAEKLQENSAASTENPVNNKNFRLVLGILTVFVGFIKLLSTMPANVPVAGDLLPALAGLLGGISILFDFYSTSSEIQMNGFFTRFFVSGRRYIGIFCILVAVLHFLFPKVIIL